MINFKGNDNLNSSKRKVRYDRLIAAGLVVSVIIILLVIIITLIFSSGKNKDNKTGNNETADSSSASDTTESSAGMKLEFEKVFMDQNEIFSGNLILVNNSHEFIFSDDKTALLQNIESSEETHYKLRSLRIQLDKNALKALSNMLNAYYTDTSDESLMITEGFVSSQQQNLMYNQALLNSINIAQGGFSEHHTGLAFDYDISETSSVKYREKYETAQKWFEEHAAEYGFIIRYPDSKKSITGISGHTNHLRYVGVPHSVYMMQNGLTLEEYTDELKKYTYGNSSLDISTDSREYSIYYSAVAPGVSDAEVCVPRSGTCSYTVSGNNSDGFIVTIEK